MALVSRATIKSWFITGLRPIQNNYHDWLDSFFHKDDTIAISNVTGLNAALSGLATTTQIDNLQAEIANGSWTPAISNAVGCTFTSSAGYYSRVGNIVTIAGSINVSAAGTGGFTFNFTIPIASDFTSSLNLIGTMARLISGSVTADTTSNDGFLFTPTSITGANTVSFTAQYIVQ
jgi:hypothetical protein